MDTIDGMKDLVHGRERALHSQFMLWVSCPSSEPCPTPPESQAILLRTPFILAPLSLKCASCCQAWCDIWIKHRHLSIPFQRQKQQTHAHSNQDRL